MSFLSNFYKFSKNKKTFFFKKVYQVIPEGFEPSTYCLEGSCSIQLSYGTIFINNIMKVGVAGFEPAASCSQSRRDNRATLHPVGAAKVSFLYFCANLFEKKFSVFAFSLKCKALSQVSVMILDRLF